MNHVEQSLEKLVDEVVAGEVSAEDNERLEHSEPLDEVDVAAERCAFDVGKAVQLRHEEFKHVLRSPSGLVQ